MVKGVGILDYNAMRRVDGAAALLSTPGLIAQFAGILTHTDAELAAKPAFELADWNDWVLWACVALMSVENVMRLVAREYSLLALLANRLPPQGAGPPFPGFVRRSQMAWFMFTWCGLLVLKLAGSATVGLFLYYVMISSYYSSWAYNG